MEAFVRQKGQTGEVSNGNSGRFTVFWGKGRVYPAGDLTGADPLTPG